MLTTEGINSATKSAKLSGKALAGKLWRKNNKTKEEIFFSTFRDLVITGYFTSEVGIKDLGYKGNQPNIWDGVPEEILKEHGLSYDKSWASKFIDQSKRNDVAVWDDKGNLIS